MRIENNRKYKKQPYVSYTQQAAKGMDRMSAVPGLEDADVDATNTVQAFGWPAAVVEDPNNERLDAVGLYATSNLGESLQTLAAYAGEREH